MKKPALGMLAAAVLLLAGCGSSGGSDYWPAAEGMTWEYAITVKTMNYWRRERLLVRNEGMGELDGAPVVMRRVGSERIDFFRVDDQGVRRMGSTQPGHEGMKPDGDGRWILRFPLAVGTQWTDETRTGVLETTVDPFRRRFTIEEPVTLTYTIDSTDDTVEVGGRRYVRCIRVRSEGLGRFAGDKTVPGGPLAINQTDWYAPGVGLVKTVRIEITDSSILPRGEFHLELAAVTR